MSLLENFKPKDEYIYDGIKIVEEWEFNSKASRNNFTIRRYNSDGIVVKKGSWRFYTVEELKYTLNDIGFKFIAGCDNLEKEPLKENTRLMRLVFEKIK